MLEIRERPPSMQKTSTADPLRGNAGDPGAPIINAKNVDSGPLAPVGGGGGSVPVQDPKGVLQTYMA
jgi:hypothetical protein